VPVSGVLVTSGTNRSGFSCFSSPTLFAANVFAAVNNNKKENFTALVSFVGIGVILSGKSTFDRFPGSPLWNDACLRVSRVSEVRD
jgi:hypothetical protein